MARMAEPIRRRCDFVFAATSRRGVAEPCVQGHKYNLWCVMLAARPPLSILAQIAKDSWVEWYENNPLSNTELQEALNQWKIEFPIDDHAARQMALGLTRAHKARARQIRRGAFKTYVRNTCIDFRLAMAFLSHPPATLRTELKSWADHHQQYMRSAYPQATTSSQRW